MDDTSPFFVEMPEAVRATADATIRVIARQGFDRVSVRTVAAELGVAPGTVQYRAASRQALLTDALVRSVQRQTERALNHQVDPARPSSLVGSLSELLPTTGEAREDAVCWVAFGAAASTRSWLATLFQEAVGLFHESVEIVLTACRDHGSLRDGLEPVAAARLVTALVNGLTLDALNDPEPDPEAMVARLCDGLHLLLDWRTA